PPGGRVDVETSSDGSSAILCVRDTGVGISPEMLPRVFELFVQAPGTLDRSQGGMGIGLTLVQRLVSLHRGSVVARSKGSGKGSEFEVRLPLSRSDMAGTAKYPSPTDPASHLVIVAEDNDGTHDVPQGALEAH